MAEFEIVDSNCRVKERNIILEYKMSFCALAPNFCFNNVQVTQNSFK